MTRPASCWAVPCPWCAAGVGEACVDDARSTYAGADLIWAHHARWETWAERHASVAVRRVTPDVLARLRNPSLVEDHAESWARTTVLRGDLTTLLDAWDELTATPGADPDVTVTGAQRARAALRAVRPGGEEG